MTIEDELVLLEQSKLFEGVDRGRLKLMAMTGDRFSFRKGDILIGEGEAPEYVYILLSGQVILGAGFESEVLVGAVGVLLRRPYHRSAVAETDVEALRLDRASFIEVLKCCSETSMAVIRELCRLIDFMNTHSRPVSTDR